jgi:hypothetical protein
MNIIRQIIENGDKEDRDIMISKYINIRLEEINKYKNVLKGIFSIIFVISLVSWVEGGVGTTAANYLKIAPGIRANGMGGAYVSLAKDSSATYWNPGGLGLVESTQIGLMHLSYIEGINYEYGDIAIPIKDAGVIGINFSLLNSGNIDQTGEDSNNNYVLISTYNYEAVVGTVSYGVKIGEIAVGGSLKVLYDQMAGDLALGVGIDVGGIYETEVRGLSLGLAVVNIGPQIKGSSIPMVIKSGIGYEKELIADHKVSMAVDYNYEIEGRSKVSVGVEYEAFKIISIRGGYRFNDDEYGITAGIGVKAKVGDIDVGIDYSYIPSKDFGLTHRVGLSAVFAKR